VQLGELRVQATSQNAGDELNMKRKFTSRGLRYQSRQAGQAMVEFMLVTVFLFVLFVSVLQMILLMHAYNTLADAAKEGMRYQIVHGTGNSLCSGPGTTGPPAVACADTTGNNVKTVVTNFAALSFQSIKASNVTVDYNPNSANGSACNVPGCLVRVTVTYTYTPFFGLGWPKFPLNAAADGRIMN
jgi:Flp pilus assembly protein TadG